MSEGVCALPNRPFSEQVIDGVIRPRKTDLRKGDEKQPARFQDASDLLGHAFRVADVLHHFDGNDEVKSLVGEGQFQRIFDLVAQVGNMRIKLAGKSDVVFIDIAPGYMVANGGNHGVVVAFAGAKAETFGEFFRFAKLREVFTDEAEAVAVGGKEKFVVQDRRFFSYGFISCIKSSISVNLPALISSSATKARSSNSL